MKRDLRLKSLIRLKEMADNNFIILNNDGDAEPLDSEDMDTEENLSEENSTSETSATNKPKPRIRIISSPVIKVRTERNAVKRPKVIVSL
jgi:hypothetical protein